MNNRSNSRNGSNMYYMRVINRLCSKFCESEFDYPWQNISDNDDMENILFLTSVPNTTKAGKKPLKGRRIKGLLT